jgi:anti-sigma B factor antagonist
MDLSNPRRLERPFEMRLEPRGRMTLLLLAGEFDIGAKNEFEARLADALSAGPEEVIVDLRDVEFIGSTGLRLLLEAWNLSRRDGFDFTLLPVTGAVRRLFEETGLDQTFPIVDGVPASEFKGARPGSGNGTFH